MVAPVLNALASGYSSKIIIQMLMKQFPQHASKIQDAVNLGFGPKEILKFLVGGRKGLADEGFLTEHEEAAGRREQRSENVNRAALAAGAGALGIVGALGLQGLPIQQPPVLPTQQAIPQQTVQQGINQQAINRAVPNTGIPQSTSQIAAQAAIQPQATPTPQPNQPPPIVPQGKPALQIAQELNLMPHIQSLSKNYQDPKHVAAILYSQFPKEMQQFQKEAAKPMEEAIAETMQSIPKEQNAPIQPQRKPATLQNVKELNELFIKSKEMNKNFPHSLDDIIHRNLEVTPEEAKEYARIFENPEVGSKVITPSDEIGEIEKISGKTAQIKTEDGKIGAPLEKALPVTEEFNDVLDNYKKLIESIPEEHKSAVVNFIGYDPDRRKLSVRFHGGDQYNYEDLDEEDVKKIADAFHLAKTSGENMYGAWSPNDPSRGAGIHKLVKELQAKYGGKGKEYSAKFKTLYDYLALPKQMLAEEEKRKKDEERTRKKAQKGR